MPVVGIDYLPAVTHAPGMGRYARELVRALAPLGTRPDLRLFDIGGGPRQLQEPSLGLVGAERVHRRTHYWPRRAVSALGRIGLGADRLLGGVDLFHRTLPGHPPVSRAPQVLPVAELPAAGSSDDQRLAAACVQARALVVFCEHYRGAISARYGIDPAAIHLTPVGCEHWARELPTLPPPPERPLVLALGAIRKQRMPYRALEAFELLRSGGIDAELFLVGHRGDAAVGFEQLLEKSNHRGSITWIREPREADMPGLTAKASVLLHLSEDEGSPVTPLEAFSLGRPVACSDLPAFREALGDEANYLPDQPSSLQVSDALAAAISGDSPAAQERRVELASGYTWQGTARSTVRVWEQLLGQDS